MNDMETNNVTQWVIIGAAVIGLVIGGAWLAMRGFTNEEIREIISNIG